MSQLTDNRLWNYSEGINRGWIYFGIKILGLTPYDLDVCENDSDSRRETVFAMLKKWRDQNKNNATYQNMLHCIREYRNRIPDTYQSPTKNNNLSQNPLSNGHSNSNEGSGVHHKEVKYSETEDFRSNPHHEGEKSSSNGHQDSTHTPDNGSYSHLGTTGPAEISNQLNPKTVKPTVTLAASTGLPQEKPTVTKKTSTSHLTKAPVAVAKNSGQNNASNDSVFSETREPTKETSSAPKPRMKIAVQNLVPPRKGNPLLKDVSFPMARPSTNPKVFQEEGVVQDKSSGSGSNQTSIPKTSPLPQQNLKNAVVWQGGTGQTSEAQENAPQPLKPGYIYVRESASQTSEDTELKFSKTKAFKDFEKAEEKNVHRTKSVRSPDIFGDGDMSMSDETPLFSSEMPAPSNKSNGADKGTLSSQDLFEVGGTLASTEVPSEADNISIQPVRPGNDLNSTNKDSVPINAPSSALEMEDPEPMDMEEDLSRTLTPEPAPESQEEDLSSQRSLSPVPSSQETHASPGPTSTGSSSKAAKHPNLSGSQDKRLKSICKYLEKYYTERLSKINVLPFAEKHSVSEIYSDVCLLGEVGEAIQGDKKKDKQVLNSADDIFFDPDVNRGSGRRILVGDGGSGKTTLTSKFAADWANRAKTISSPWKNKVLFVIPLRLVSRGMTFLQALNNIMPKELNMREKEFDDIIFKIQSDVFIILDGWDEIDPVSFKGEAEGLNLLDIANMKQLQQANVLITMRRFALPQFSAHSNYAVLEVEGFSSDEQKQKYVEKSLTSQVKVREVLSLIKQQAFLQTISRTPLFLALLCEMAKGSNISNPQNPAVRKMVPFLHHCWDIFVSHCKSKVKNEKGTTFIEDDFDQKITEMTDKLGMVALNGVMDQVQTWEQTKMIEEIGQSNFDLAKDCGLLKVTSLDWEITTRQRSGVQDQYQGQQDMVGFFHKLFQEKCAGGKLGELSIRNPDLFKHYLNKVNGNEEQLKLMDCALKCACYVGGLNATKDIVTHLIGKGFDGPQVSYVLFECIYEAMDDSEEWNSMETMNDVNSLCLNSLHESYSQDAIIGGLKIKRSLETLQLENCPAVFNRRLVKGLDRLAVGLLTIDGRASSVFKSMANGTWKSLRNLLVKNSKQLTELAMKALMSWALKMEVLETIRFENCKFEGIFGGISGQNTLLEFKRERKYAAFVPQPFTMKSVHVFRLHGRGRNWRKGSKQKYFDLRSNAGSGVEEIVLSREISNQVEEVFSSSDESPDPTDYHHSNEIPFQPMIASTPVSNPRIRPVNGTVTNDLIQTPTISQVSSLAKSSLDLSNGRPPERQMQVLSSVKATPVTAPVPIGLFKVMQTSPAPSSPSTDSDGSASPKITEMFLPDLDQSSPELIDLCESDDDEDDDAEMPSRKRRLEESPHPPNKHLCVGE